MDTALYDHFLSIVQSGDEDAAREFIAKHVNEFSESAKIAIMGGSLGEMLEEAAEGAEKLAQAQEDSVEALENIGTLKADS
ncbi:hypothetical protein HY968_03940 [Candidatus Kaiserbacteria bacterium]|nr:hypothetical protein [Candidatus Kaiserbacteria bacterium]